MSKISTKKNYKNIFIIFLILILSFSTGSIITYFIITNSHKTNNPQKSISVQIVSNELECQNPDSFAIVKLTEHYFPQKNSNIEINVGNSELLVNQTGWEIIDERIDSFTFQNKIYLGHCDQSDTYKITFFVEEVYKSVDVFVGQPTEKVIDVTVGNNLRIGNTPTSTITVTYVNFSTTSHPMFDSYTSWLECSEWTQLSANKYSATINVGRATVGQKQFYIDVDYHTTLIHKQCSIEVLPELTMDVTLQSNNLKIGDSSTSAIYIIKEYGGFDETPIFNGNNSGLSCSVVKTSTDNNPTIYQATITIGTCSVPGNISIKFSTTTIQPGTVISLTVLNDVVYNTNITFPTNNTISSSNNIIQSNEINDNSINWNPIQQNNGISITKTETYTYTGLNYSLTFDYTTKKFKITIDMENTNTIYGVHYIEVNIASLYFNFSANNFLIKYTVEKQTGEYYSNSDYYIINQGIQQNSITIICACLAETSQTGNWENEDMKVNGNEETWGKYVWENAFIYENSYYYINNIFNKMLDNYTFAIRFSTEAVTHDTTKKAEVLNECYTKKIPNMINSQISNLKDFGLKMIKLGKGDKFGGYALGEAGICNLDTNEGSFSGWGKHEFFGHCLCNFDDAYNRGESNDIATEPQSQYSIMYQRWCSFANLGVDYTSTNDVFGNNRTQNDLIWNRLTTNSRYTAGCPSWTPIDGTDEPVLWWIHNIWIPMEDTTMRNTRGYFDAWMRFVMYLIVQINIEGKKYDYKIYDYNVTDPTNPNYWTSTQKQQVEDKLSNFYTYLNNKITSFFAFDI